VPLLALFTRDLSALSSVLVLNGLGAAHLRRFLDPCCAAFGSGTGDS
jgi:hypothetical protein